MPHRPTGLALNQAGDRLYVTTLDPEGSVYVIDAEAQRVVSVLRAGHTTAAPVLSGDERTLYVLNRFDNDLSVLDLESGRELRRVPLGPEPAAAALSPDGKLLIVADRRAEGPATAAYVAARVRLIDTERTETVATIDLPNGAVGVRGIAVSPDGRYAFVTHILARNHVPATHLDEGWLTAAGVSVIDLRRRELLAAVALDQVGRGAALPWGAACSPDGKKLYVALAGVHELATVDLPELIGRLRDFAAQPPPSPKSSYAYAAADEPHTNLNFLLGVLERTRLPGKGPRSLLLRGGRLFAAMYFDGAVASVELADPAKIAKIALGDQPPMNEVRRGEMLFNDATMAFQGWQACATCHPDGRTDGLNWDLTNDGIGNTKNVRSLLFASQTAPLTTRFVSGIYGRKIMQWRNMLRPAEPGQPGVRHRLG